MTTTGMQTTPEISNERRTAIKQAVIETLTRYCDGSVPVKIGGIIRAQREKIKLITYSSVMRKDKVTYAEIVSWAGTEDAFCVHDRSKDKYCIYYNDISENIVKSYRVRWNLAHELGHVVLRHHDYCDSEKLFRGTVSDPIYKQLEAEADYFAQLILVPHPVLLALRVKSASDIRQLCHISFPASQRRYNEYRVWKQRGDADVELYREPYDTAVFHFFYNFIFKKECPRCGAGFVQRRGKYCPICGYSPIKRGDGKMFHSGVKLNEKMHAVVCPICQNEEHLDETNFCMICGAVTVNHCTEAIDNEYPSSFLQCSHAEPLPGNARFCPFCGSKTTFFIGNLLQPWDKKKTNPFAELDDGDEKLPF